MTQEEQRIAIAEVCGWKIESDLTGIKPPGCDAFTYRGYASIWTLIPDYLNDLNAMQEAEKTLNNANLCDSYVRYLCVILDWKLPFEANQLYVWKSIVSATASQRAEAFLRTVGKWIDHPATPHN